MGRLFEARTGFRAGVAALVSALALSLGIAGALPAAAAVPAAGAASSGVTVTATGGNVLAGATRTISVSGGNPDGIDLALGLMTVAWARRRRRELST